MKNFKKFTAAIAATLMAATMVAPMALNATVASAAVATSVEFDLSYDGFNSIAPTAYRIFSIKAETTGYSTTETADWTSSAMGAAVNEALGTSSEPLAADKAMAKISATDFDAEAFAKALAKIIAADTQDSFASVKETLTETGAGSKKFKFGKEVADGYYIVLAKATKDNGTGTEDDETVWSLGMLSIIDGRTTDGVDHKIGKGSAKVSLPSVQKKVLEDDNKAMQDDDEWYADYEGTDAHWNDVADLQIGQTATFRLYGTLPSNYDSYDTYKYIFHDTLDKQFAEVDPNDITVKVYANADAAKAGTNGVAINATKSVQVVGESGVTDATLENGTQKITISWNDLKTATVSDTQDDDVTTEGFEITSSSVIVVEYTTKLTDKAVLAKDGAQENKVKLEYSNNPHSQGQGDTSTTPEDKVGVYTYDFEFEKEFVNQTSDLTPEEILEGTYESSLTFSITNKKFKKTVNPDDDGEDEEANALYENYDYVLVDDSEDADEEEIFEKLKLTLVKKVDGKWVRVTDQEITDARNKYTGNGVEKNVEGAKDDVKDWKLVVRIKGLDSGTYTITEDMASTWQEYATLQGDEGKFALESNLTYSQDLSSFDAENATLTNGEIDEATREELEEMIIQNKKGSSLPSTGGIGTTLFYLGGGAMVAVAGVFLITKKRMGKDEA